MADDDLIENKDSINYLQDWVLTRQESWIRILVSKIVEDGRPPADEFLGQIYNSFCIENELTRGVASKEKSPMTTQKESVSHDPKSSVSPQTLSLLELKHIHGANALKDGQTIEFHPNLTVVFGHNGAGKSGYVRILKRMCGSPSREDIWSNVHVEQKTNQCEATVRVALDGKEETICWKGNEFGVAPLTNVSIFDGKCVPIYLKERQDFTYQPYRFELFKILSDALVELQEKLEAEVITKQNGSTNILSALTPGTGIYNSVDKQVQDNNYQQLLKLSTWNKRLEKSLQQKVSDRGKLESSSDKLELLQQKRQQLGALFDVLKNIGSALSKEELRAQKIRQKRLVVLEKNADRLNKSLFASKNIPEINSDSWKNLILNGEEYIKLACNSGYPVHGDKCIYCRQDLSIQATKLISQYRQAVLVWTSEERSRVEDEIDKFIKTISQLEIPEIENDDQVSKIIGKGPTKNLLSLLSVVKGCQENILNKDGSIDQEIKTVSVKATLTKIDRVISALNSQENKLAEKEKNKNDLVAVLDAEIATLSDQRKLSKMRKQIFQNFRIAAWLDKAECAKNKLTTKPVTDLAKEAWNDLVSTTFKEQFKKEASSLSAPEMDISFPAEYGVQKREKYFAGLRNVGDFLSESEQRAVAVADFLAEVQLKSTIGPLVFDDPVNSFDENRRRVLAERIVEESKIRQVIVFTHDIFFMSHIFELLYGSDKYKPDNKLAKFHWLENLEGVAGIVNKDSCPTISNFGQSMLAATELVPKIKLMQGLERKKAIEEAYDFLRVALEFLVLEKFFRNIVRRWREQMQMMNLDEVVTDSGKYNAAKKLYIEFSGYSPAHSHDAVAIQNFPELSKLEADISIVRGLAS